ncbi:MAG: hypothetical protein DRI61_10395 [Chloroflexi bacterium]|nr:MAG: hypothetical protein DRI61_10395 [Chloroflexota bacterium]
MIRPLSTPLDLWLVYNFRHKGMGLGLMEGEEAPLNRVMVALIFSLVAEDQMATYVMQETDDNGHLRGFIQVQRDPYRPGVQVIYLAPSPVYEESAYQVWARLLEYAVLRLRNLGVKRLFADVPEAEEEPFRELGFALYAREDVYILEEAPRNLPEPEGWRPSESKDRWDVQRLYKLTTPLPVQQVENTITGITGSEGFLSRFLRKREEWLLRSKGETIAYLQGAREGGMTSLRLVIHPEFTSESEKLVGTALALASLRWPAPYAIRVRNYEGGIRGALESWSGRFYKTLSLMVRHTFAFEKVEAKSYRPVRDLPVGVLPVNITKLAKGGEGRRRCSMLKR